ncbi:MAG: antitoxin component YwqK of YwqJK toxin-antitoxin module, partial [Gammaproteobacteria bacterium]
APRARGAGGGRGGGGGARVWLGWKMIEHDVKNNTVHGEYNTWYYNNQNRWQATYKNDMGDGKLLSWYRNGSKQCLIINNKIYT